MGTAGVPVMELTEQQIAVLQRLRVRGFELVAFPLYANHVGVRRGECAALLAPVPGGMKVFGDAFYLVAGNPAVRVNRGGRDIFVWKSNELPATPEHIAELAQFSEALAESLLTSV